jgi:hypothetical protein
MLYPLIENPRAALLLVNGTVYLSWGSACDDGDYYGWMMAYDAQTLQQKAALITRSRLSCLLFWAEECDTELGKRIPQ